jgi:hypothetical protein
MDISDRCWGEKPYMEIVFVHFNTQLPKFLKENIRTCMASFPNATVTLIVNNIVKDPHIKNLKIVKYEPDDKWKEIDDLLEHPKDFRNNFWMISISRFLAIADYMESNNKEIMHVESDVILSKDFPFQKFSQLKSPISYPVVSKLRGVASTIYFRDSEIARKLADFALECIRKDSRTSDMLILRKFYNSYPELVSPLPFGPTAMTSYSSGVDDELILRSTQNQAILGGVFDGSDIGVYYFGTDPRNDRGVSTFRVPIPESLANYNEWRLTLDKNRAFPNISTNRKSIPVPIYSIHITCKDVNLFRVRTRNKIMSQRIHASQEKQTSKIYFLVLSKQILKSIRRRANF